jgi:hypothetical protein
MDPACLIGSLPELLSGKMRMAQYVRHTHKNVSKISSRTAFPSPQTLKQMD